MKKVRTFEQLCAVVLLNEIAPRLKRAGLPLTSISPEVTSGIVAAEFIGAIDRGGVRKILDHVIQRTREA